MEEYWERDAVLYAGLACAARRGTAVYLERQADGVFLQDSVSGVYMLAADDPALARRWLAAHAHRGYGILMLFDRELAGFARAQYGFSGGMDCFSAAYVQPVPPAGPCPLDIRPATAADLPAIAAHYHILGEAELAAIQQRGELFTGWQGGALAGFLGLHAEGSMGLLEVLPAYRRQGYGAALERWLIARVLARGQTPFCQVEVHNARSLALQKKLGLTLSPVHTYWLF